MVIEDYVKQIKLMLGSPVLEIEIEGKLKDVVKLAFNELKLYIDTPHYDTLKVQVNDENMYKSGYDVSEFHVRAVLFVSRGTISLISANDSSDALLWSPLSITLNQNWNYSYNYGYSKSPYSQLNLLKGYTTSQLYQQLRNSLQQDLDFTFDAYNQKLYLYQQIPNSEQITIVYNKEYMDVDEIKDPFWSNLLFRLSLAYAKQILGRIRGKYRMASAPYELDADTLLSEASEELGEIRQFLTENNNVFIPRD